MKSLFVGSLVLVGVCCLSSMGCRSAGRSVDSPAASGGSQTREYQPSYQEATGSGTQSAPSYQGSSSR